MKLPCQHINMFSLYLSFALHQLNLINHDYSLGQTDRSFGSIYINIITDLYACVPFINVFDSIIIIVMHLNFS